MRIGRAWVALCLMVLSDYAVGTELQGVAQLLTGDTLIVQGQPVRLSGVLAPAPGQPCFSPDEWSCGDDSLAALDRLIGERVIRCIFTHKSVPPDATCWLRGVDLNAWVVAQGWGLAQDNSSPYFDLQAQAAASERGIWYGGFKPTATWTAWASQKQAPARAGSSPCSARKQSLKNKRTSGFFSELPE